MPECAVPAIEQSFGDRIFDLNVVGAGTGFCLESMCGGFAKFHLEEAAFAVKRNEHGTSKFAATDHGVVATGERAGLAQEIRLGNGLHSGEMDRGDLYCRRG